jgi:hypothetical protein
MSYANFTLKDVKLILSLSINERVSLFSEAAEYSVSDHLLETLKENVPLALAISTEKARSELIIAPILVELRKLLNYKISLFSGIELDVDSQRGLNGICDFVISRSDEQLFLSSPIITIVEAKNENIKGGLAQCIAEMYAAMLFNLDFGILDPLARQGISVTWMYNSVIAACRTPTTTCSYLF